MQPTSFRFLNSSQQQFHSVREPIPSVHDTIQSINRKIPSSILVNRLLMLSLHVLAGKLQLTSRFSLLPIRLLDLSFGDGLLPIVLLLLPIILRA